MDALEFLRAHKRMCNRYEGCCDCPLEVSICPGSTTMPDEDYKKLITVVEHWSKEHPYKTRQDVFLEQYPDFWVEEVMRLVDVACDQLDYVIIDDVRFPNEITRWQRTWFPILTVRVERPGHENALTPEQRRHPSETALDVFPHDCHVFARDVAQLERKMEVVLATIPTGKEARR